MATDFTEFPPVDAGPLVDPGPPAAVKSAPLVFAGFWARLAAFIIDLAVIAVIQAVVGAALWEACTAMRGLAPLAGLFLVLAYAGPGNSDLGDGQTWGKKALGLRVVRRDGCCLSFGQSLGRTTLLWAPIIAGHMWFGPSDASWAEPLRQLVGTGLGGAFVYLFIFGAPARQMPHDLAFGTYVVRSDAKGPISAPPLARVHRWVAGAWVALSVLGCIVAFASPPASEGLVAELTAAQNAVYADPAVSRVTLHYGVTRPGGRPVTSAVIWYAESPASYDSSARSAARAIVKASPAARSCGSVVVQMYDGWDLGVVRLWRHPYRVEDTPDNWLNATRPGRVISP